MSEQYTTFTATFTPTRTDDLRGMARPNVGVTLDWTRYWLIEDGPYKGQWACLPTHSDESFGWVPECDLTPCVTADNSEPAQ